MNSRWVQAKPWLHATRTFSSTSYNCLNQVEKRVKDEAKNVSKIRRLMALGDRLMKTPLPTYNTVPRSHAKGELNERIQRDSGAHPAPLPTTDLPELAPLPTSRRMQDSFVLLDLPFSTNSQLREQYLGGYTQVRMGRLMEDFDNLAAAAAYRHVLPDGVSPAEAKNYGLYLVTAAVDRMDMLRPLENADGTVPDLRLSGHVSYTTNSSLEVFIRLSVLEKADSAENTGESPPSTILLGRFAMACRSYSGGKHPIAQLVVDGPDEVAMWEMGREIREGKKQNVRKSLMKFPPNEDEARMMHEVFIDHADYFDRNTYTPPEVVWMRDTRVNSAQLMHPQERNVHNKVFGGYLMRLAYETAYSTACIFARSPVTFLALDELQFALPVEIGSLLHLDSIVTYVPRDVGKHRSFQISVEAATTNLYTGKKQVTNVFYFTFSKLGKPLDRYVLPRSYRDAMQWLDAQRRRTEGISIRHAYDDEA